MAAQHPAVLFVHLDAPDRQVGARIVAGLLGRGLAAPPGTPQDVVDALRAGIKKMNADPAFAADLQKRRLRLIPSEGADIQKVVAKAIEDAPPEVVARARKLIFEQ